MYTGFSPVLLGPEPQERAVDIPQFDRSRGFGRRLSLSAHANVEIGGNFGVRASNTLPAVMLYLATFEANFRGPTVETVGSLISSSYAGLGTPFPRYSPHI